MRTQARIVTTYYNIKEKFSKNYTFTYFLVRTHACMHALTHAHTHTRTHTCMHVGRGGYIVDLRPFCCLTV